MPEDKSLDVTGIGKLASAIPEEAWKELVDTACETFEKLVSPLTEITYGFGRLVQAKFDGLVDVQKVYAADNVAKAQEKAKNSKKTRKGNPKAPIVITAIEESSYQTDETIRQLWANLLAQELVSGDVHPEFTRILSRLSATDAQLLASIAEKNPVLDMKLILNIFVKSFRYSIVGIPVEKTTFNHELLENLNLIRSFEGRWKLTRIGWSFIQSVSDPSVE